MSDIQGGNLVFKGVFDDTDINRGFERAKREIQQMSGVFSKGGDAVQEYFDEIAESLMIQRSVVKDLETKYSDLNKEMAKIAPGTVKQGLIKESQQLKQELDAEKGALIALSEEAKRLNSGYSDLNKQLRFAQAEMIRLEQAGKSNTQEFRNAQAEAVRLSTSIKDVHASVTKLGDGKSNLKGINEALRGLIGAFSAGTGAVAMFTGENENLQRIMVRLQSAMAMAIGMQEISMALDKNSAFQTVTVTKVKSLYAAALNRLTVAFGGSTAAARVFMGVITGGLTIAIGAAIYAWDRYNAKQEEAKKKLQERFDLERDAKTAMFEARMELENNIRSIQSFNGTKEQEKQKIKELNEKYGESFGYFKTLSQWYDTLVGKGEVYIESLYLQAKAQTLLKKAVDADLKVKEIDETPEEYFTTLPERMGSRLANPFKRLSKEELNKQAKAAAKDDAEKAAKAYHDEFEDTMARAANLSQLNGLGGYEDPNKGGSNKKKTDDPFLKDLENKKKAYEHYAAWINSSDAGIRASADENFKGLLKNGANWLEYLNKLRNEIQGKLSESPNNQNLIKQLNEVTNQLTGSTAKEDTVLGKFEKDVDRTISNVETDIKAKLAAINTMREEMAANDPLAGEKNKMLDAASTSLTVQLFKQERTEMENTLKKYQGFLAEKLEFDRDYAEERNRIMSKVDSASNDRERAAALEMLDNLNKNREELSVSPQEKEYQELLKSYQDFEGKKKEISEKYDKEIAKARAKNNADLEKKIAAQRDKEIGKAALESLMGSEEWKKVFTDLENVSRKQIKELLKQLNGDKEGLLIDVEMSPEAKELLKKLLKDAENTVNQKNPFAQLGDAMEKLKNGGSLKDFMKDADSAADAIGGIFNTIVGGLEEMGIVTDESTKEVLNAGMKALQGLVDAVAGYFSGNTGQMVSGIVGFISGIVKLFQFKNNKINKEVEKQSVEVQKLANAYNQLGAAIDKALGEDYYKKQIESINALYKIIAALEKELELEESRRKKKQDPARIEELKNQIAENKQQYEQILQTIKDAVTQTSAVGLAGDLADAIVGAFSRGEDAAKAWGEVTNSVLQNAVKNALKMKMLEQPLQSAINQLYADMGFNADGTGSFDGLTPEEQQRFRDEVNKISQAYNEAIGATGDLFKDLENISATSPLAGAIRGMSQQSADIMAGHLNATRILMTDGIDIIRQQLLTMYAIANKLDTTNKTLEKIEKNTQKDTSDPLRASGLG